MKDHAPPVMGFFPIAASGGEAANAADGVAQGQPRCERVAGSESRHMILPDIPGCGYERRQQASGKDSAGLQGVDAENLRGVGRVVAPLVNDVKHLRPDDPAKHHENAEIPSLIPVNSQALGVAYADPQTDQDSQGNQESIRRQKELPDMKELGKHCLFRCSKAGFATRTSLAGRQAPGAEAHDFVDLTRPSRAALPQSKSNQQSRKTKAKPTH